MTTNAQLKALNHITESGTRSSWKSKIMQLFQENPLMDYTTLEVVEALGLTVTDYHLIQPRISELYHADKIKATGIERTGRDGLMIESFIFNPAPQPKKKMPRAIGDKELFKEMIKAFREYDKQDHAYSKHRVAESAKQWIWASKGLI